MVIQQKMFKILHYFWDTNQISMCEIYHYLCTKISELQS